MINIDFSSGKITPDVSGAVPATTVGQNKAAVHLTQGYNSPDTSPAFQQDNTPVNFKGEADVLVDTKQEADQVAGGSWFFGFLQVARVKEFSASWEGRRNGEGSVNLIIVGFPVSGDLVHLDSDTANQPFFDRTPHIGGSRTPAAGQRRVVHVQTSMGDHPNYRDAFITSNSITKAPNFLHTLEMTVEFTTVFVGRDGNGPIQPIAHIRWDLDLSGQIKWRNGKPSATNRVGSLVPGLSTLGPPTDPRVSAITNNPGPPLAKGEINSRYHAAMSNRLLRRESAKRSLVLPRDFFQ